MEGSVTACNDNTIVDLGTRLSEIPIIKSNIQNEGKHLDDQLRILFQRDGEQSLENRFNAANILIANLEGKIKKLQAIHKSYIDMRNEIQIKSVKEFKQNLMQEFVDTYYSTKDKITKDMIDAWERIASLEKYSCYELRGIQVSLKSCAQCRRRCDYVNRKMNGGMDVYDD